MDLHVHFTHLLFALIFTAGIFLVKGDTPANCTFEDIQGTWIFSLGPGNQARDLNCSDFNGPINTQIKITLLYPDVAIDQFNNEGFWTIIYNQGFEVNVAGRKYFAFSKYNKTESMCHQILPGWSHNVLGSDWACYTGMKTSGPTIPKKSIQHAGSSLKFEHLINSLGLVKSINHMQKSWRATHYPQFDHLTQEDLIKMTGGRASQFSRPKIAPITEDQRRKMAALPAHFDWREVDGFNYVSPVRNQAQCGSCYAFASMAMNEARVRIMTNNTQTPVFSPQDIVECSEYSQGCAGGFPYLIGGKYAEDFGLVLEECNPYKGADGQCSTDPKCPRHYSTNFKYVGGYYGACNEPAMMEAVYERGPVAVGFEVYGDFMNYQSGVYHHVFNESLLKFDPFQLTNHAVLVVGWGYDESSAQKYWIVKNSWSTSWGLEGYFWIRRGNDECGIESMAVESAPIMTN